MKTACKQLSVAFLSSIITMTLLLAPLPGIHFNEAMAQETSTTTTESSKPGIYKPGEEFNKDLTTKTKFKDHTEAGGDGVMKLIEQYVGALFAVVGLTLFAVPKPEALATCPTNQAINVTFPLIQAGSVAYLAGEIMANEEFKKGSKIAVDHNFAEKKDENVKHSKKLTAQNKSANRKQIKAFESLEKIYGHQVKGMQTKIKMATAAEIAFITAFGFELSNMLKIGTTGAAATTKYITARDAYLTQLTTSVGTINSAAQAYYAASPAATALGAACTAAGVQLKAYIANVKATDTALAVEGPIQSTEKETTMFAKIGTLTTNLAASAMAAVAKAGKAITSFLGFAKAEDAKDTTIATTNDTKATTYKTTRAAITTPLITTLGTCPAAGTAAIPIVKAHEVLRASPIICTGVKSMVMVTGDHPQVMKPYVEKNIDNNQHLMIAQTSQEKQKYYVRLLMENFLHNLAKLKIDKEFPTDSSEKLKAIASTSKYIDYVVEEQMNAFNSNKIKEQMNLELKNELANNGSLDSIIKKRMNELNNLIIKDAHAFDFKSLLNVGGKILIMYFTLSSLLKEYAFPTPQTRTYTWGAMAALNALIIMHDKKAEKAAKDRLAKVKAEKERFLNSSARKTEVQEGATPDSIKTTKSTSSALANNYDSTDYEDSNACFQKAGSEVEQTKCANKKTKEKFQLKTLSNGGNAIAGNSFINATAQLSDITSDIANGQALKNSNIVGGKIGQLTNSRNALMKRNEELVKAYDDLNEKNSNDKKKTKSSSLKRILASFKNDYMNNSSSPVSSGQLANKGNLNSSVKEKKKVAKAKIPTFKTPAVNIPSFGSDFDTDDYNAKDGTPDKPSSLSNAKAEEKLDSFEVEHNDINDNPGVSIFKLISNRYLKSYSTFIEVRKKKSE